MKNILLLKLNSPRPLRPTNLRSLNLATWFLITAVEFLSSAEKLSSLPARIVTVSPSGISPLKAITLKATGSVLLHLQCDGNTLHTKFGESVLTSSPGFSDNASNIGLSGLNLARIWFESTFVEAITLLVHSNVTAVDYHNEPSLQPNRSAQYNDRRGEHSFTLDWRARMFPFS